MRNTADVLLAEKTDTELKRMAGKATRLTAQFFGKTIKLYAPLYLSNYCKNGCPYCGFKNGNTFGKKLLNMDEIQRETDMLVKTGMQEILLVAGDDPDKITAEYLAEAVSLVKTKAPSVSIETAPFSEKEYRKLVDAGLDGVTLYQETYNRGVYRALHRKGGKSDYDYRYETPFRAGRAGVRKIGMGVLLGLADWRGDFKELLFHARTVEKECWKTSVSISFPRIRDSLSGFRPDYPISDRDLLHAVCAARISMNQTDLVLSTREYPEMRDNLLGVGITKISAGSRTAPGAYTLADEPGEQFSVSDERSVENVVKAVMERGFQPVWKDWEACMK